MFALHKEQHSKLWVSKCIRRKPCKSAARNIKRDQTKRLKRQRLTCNERNAASNTKPSRAVGLQRSRTKLNPLQHWCTLGFIKGEASSVWLISGFLEDTLQNCLFFLTRPDSCLVRSYNFSKQTQHFSFQWDSVAANIRSSKKRLINGKSIITMLKKWRKRFCIWVNI